MECHFPIIESEGFIVAVLLCDTSREHIGLILRPSDDPVQDLSRKKYYTGGMFSIHGFRRLILLGNDLYNLRLNGKPVTAEWRDIVIAEAPSLAKRDAAPSRCFALHSITPAPPFRIPHWLISRLAQVGMEMRPISLQNIPTNGMPLRVTAEARRFCSAYSILSPVRVTYAPLSYHSFPRHDCHTMLSLCAILKSAVSHSPSP